MSLDVFLVWSMYLNITWNIFLDYIGFFLKQLFVTLVSFIIPPLPRGGGGYTVLPLSVPRYFLGNGICKSDTSLVFQSHLLFAILYLCLTFFQINIVYTKISPIVFSFFYYYYFHSIRPQSIRHEPSYKQLG